MSMATIRTRPEGAARRTQPRGPRSARSWTATTLTGVGLLLLVGIHMVANHFVVESVGGLRSYHQVLEYISDPAIFTIEAIFLLFVTVHAMLGVRGVLLDLDPSPRAQRWIDVGLVTLGLLTLAYGYFLIGTLASRA
jgi:succinate dehydrogenase hydrophobic anchor subunit